MEGLETNGLLAIGKDGNMRMDTYAPGVREAMEADAAAYEEQQRAQEEQHRQLKAMEESLRAYAIGIGKGGTLEQEYEQGRADAGDLAYLDSDAANVLPGDRAGLLGFEVARRLGDGDTWGTAERVIGMLPEEQREEWTKKLHACKQRSEGEAVLGDAFAALARDGHEKRIAYMQNVENMRDEELKWLGRYFAGREEMTAEHGEQIVGLFGEDWVDRINRVRSTAQLIEDFVENSEGASKTSSVLGFEEAVYRAIADPESGEIDEKSRLLMELALHGIAEDVQESERETNSFVAGYNSLTATFVQLGEGVVNDWNSDEFKKAQERLKSMEWLMTDRGLTYARSHAAGGDLSRIPAHSVLGGDPADWGDLVLDEDGLRRIREELLPAARKEMARQNGIKVVRGMLQDYVQTADSSPEGTAWYKKMLKGVGSMGGETLPYFIPYIGVYAGTVATLSSYYDRNMNANMAAGLGIDAAGNRATQDAYIAAGVELMPWSRVGGRGFNATLGRAMKRAGYKPGWFAGKVADFAGKGTGHAMLTESIGGFIDEGVLEPLGQGLLTLGTDAAMDALGIAHGESRSFGEAFAELRETWTDPTQLAALALFTGGLAGANYFQIRGQSQAFAELMRKLSKDVGVWQAAGLTDDEVKQVMKSDNPLETGSKLFNEALQKDPEGLKARMREQGRKLQEDGFSLKLTGTTGELDANTEAAFAEAYRELVEDGIMPAVARIADRDGQQMFRLTWRDRHTRDVTQELELDARRADTYLQIRMAEVDERRLRNNQETVYGEMAQHVDQLAGTATMQQVERRGEAEGIQVENMNELGEGVGEMVQKQGVMSYEGMKRAAEKLGGMWKSLMASFRERAEGIAGKAAETQGTALFRKRSQRAFRRSGKSIFASILSYARGNTKQLEVMEDTVESLADMWIQLRALENSGRDEAPSAEEEAKALAELADIVRAARAELMKLEPGLRISEVPRNASYMQVIEALSDMGRARFIASSVMPAWMSEVQDMVSSALDETAEAIRIAEAAKRASTEEMPGWKKLEEIFAGMDVPMGNIFSEARIDAAVIEQVRLARARMRGEAVATTAAEVQEKQAEDKARDEEIERAEEEYAKACPEPPKAAGKTPEEEVGDQLGSLPESKAPKGMQGVFVKDGCVPVDDGNGTFYVGLVPVKNLRDSKEVQQVKVGTKGKHGVINPITGEYQLATEAVYVWRRKDGALEVISGRHKYALALEDGTEAVICYVFNEDARHDVKWARLMDFENNMRGDQADELTAAIYVRETGYDDATLLKKGLMRNKSKSKRGILIGREARQELWDRFVNRAVTPERAELICEMTKTIKDKDRIEEIQRRCCMLYDQGKGDEYVNAMVQLMASKTSKLFKQGLFDFGEDFEADLEKAATFVEKCVTQLKEALKVIKQGKKLSGEQKELAARLGTSATSSEATDAMARDIADMLVRFQNIGMHPELLAAANMWDGKSKLDAIGMALSNAGSETERAAAEAGMTREEWEEAQALKAAKQAAEEGTGTLTLSIREAKQQDHEDPTASFSQKRITENYPVAPYAIMQRPDGSMYVRADETIRGTGHAKEILAGKIARMTHLDENGNVVGTPGMGVKAPDDDNEMFIMQSGVDSMLSWGHVQVSAAIADARVHITAATLVDKLWRVSRKTPKGWKNNRGQIKDAVQDYDAKNSDNPHLRVRHRLADLQMTDGVVYEVLLTGKLLDETGTNSLYMVEVHSVQKKKSAGVDAEADDIVSGTPGRSADKVIETHESEIVKGENEIGSNFSASMHDYASEMQDIIDKAKADGTYMLAPNGKPTNLTEHQWAQVRTQAFKAWFGDWENDPENVSKVLDENGEPKVVYHNSGARRKVLSREYSRKSMDIESVCFAPESDPYGEYGPHEHAVFLRIVNPADYKTAYREHGIQLGRTDDAGVKIREWLQERDYDGVIEEEDGAPFEYKVFESTQEKSATDNRGTFSPADDRISFSLRETRGYVSDRNGNLVPLDDIEAEVHERNAARVSEIMNDPRYAATLEKIKAALDGKLEFAFVYRDLNDAEVQLFRKSLGFDFSGYAWQIEPRALLSAKRQQEKKDSGGKKAGKFDLRLTENEFLLIPCIIDDIAESGSTAISCNVNELVANGTVFVEVINPITKTKLNFLIAPKGNKQLRASTSEEKKKPKLSLKSVQAFLGRGAGLSPASAPHSAPPGNSDGTTSTEEIKSNLLKQEFSSRDTSINKAKIPAVFGLVKKADGWKQGTLNIDIGGGKYDTLTNALAQEGVQSYIYEPFGRTSEQNAAVLAFLQSGEKGDTATCSNVLNVIKEEDVRSNVIHQVAKAIKPDGTAYFTIYEAKGNGIGARSKDDCWQNNRKTAFYVDEIKRHFGEVVMKGNLIVARKPLGADQPAVWRLGGDTEATATFSLRDMTQSARIILQRRDDDIEGEELIARWDELLQRLETASNGRHDGAARLGVLVALLESTRKVLPPQYAKLGRLHALMKWAAVYAHLVSTGQVKRDGVLKGEIFEKFVAAMQREYEGGLQKGLSEADAREALQELGEKRLEEALVKVAKECRGRLDIFVKARARERIELMAERAYPKKERGRKSPRGKMEAPYYRAMSTMLAWMDAPPEQVADRVKELRALLEQVDGDEGGVKATREELEEELRIVQLYGDWAGMSAGQARRVADDFATFVLTHRHEWDAKLDDERRRRQFVRMKMRFTKPYNSNTRSDEKRDGSNAKQHKRTFKAFMLNMMNYAQLMNAGRRVFGSEFVRSAIQAIADAMAALRNARRDRDDAFARMLMDATGLTKESDLVRWLNEFSRVEKHTGIFKREVTLHTLRMARTEAEEWCGMTRQERTERRRELEAEAERTGLAPENVPTEQDIEKLREGLDAMEARGSVAKNVSVKVPRYGKEVELEASRDAVANAILLLEQEDYRHLIEYEGLVPRDANGKVIDREKDQDTPIDVEQTLAPLYKFLGKDGRAFAYAMRRYVGENGKKMQAVYEAQMGIPLQMKPNYWRGNFDINTVKEKDTLTESNGGVGMGGGYGFLIDRVHHYNRLNWANTATNVFGVTVEAQNNYTYTSGITREWRALLSDTDFEKRMEVELGRPYILALKEWLDIIDGVNRKAPAATWFRRFMAKLGRGLAVSALAGNGFVLTKQSSAILHGLMGGEVPRGVIERGDGVKELTWRKIGFFEYAAAAARVKRDSGKVSIDELRSCDWFKARMNSRYENIARRMGLAEDRKQHAFANKVADKSMDVIEATDRYFNLRGMLALADAVYCNLEGVNEKQGLGMTEAQLKKEALAAVGRALAISAQPHEAGEKSLFAARGGLLTNMLFQFRSETVNKVGLLCSRILAGEAGIGIRDYLLFGGHNALLYALIAWIRYGDEPEEEEEWKYFANIGVNILTGDLAALPAVGDLVKSVTDKALGKYHYERGLISNYFDPIGALKSAERIWTGEKGRREMGWHDYVVEAGSLVRKLGPVSAVAGDGATWAELVLTSAAIGNAVRTGADVVNGVTREE